MDWIHDEHPLRNPLVWLMLAPALLGGGALLALCFWLGRLAGRR